MEQGQDIYFSDVNTRIRDVEEKVGLLRDRVVLIGQNLIETKLMLDSVVKEVKLGVENLKKEMEKLKERIGMISEEMDGFARRDEVNLIRKQFKMFEPLHFARIDDVERIADERVKALLKSREKHLLEKDKRGYIF